MIDQVARIRDLIANQSPEGLLVGGFSALIALGTGLLVLPWAHHGQVGFLEALFTATSGVCVTGLIVVDTGGDYTVFGQLVILLLIQAGGIGIMSFAAIAYQLLGRRLNLRAQAALSSSMLQREAATEFRNISRRILHFVLLAESVGALLLFVGMLPAKGAADAAYSAVFHAVSAFCNAGFSLYSDSLTAFRGNGVVMTTIMTLIVLGGIGHPVVIDVWQRIRPRPGEEKGSLRKLALSSRVAIWTSGALIAAGFVLLLAFGLTAGETTWPDRVGGALFQSITARTAGFNTVEIGDIELAPLFLLVMLMFIGGSPGSCAGGIKTTTFALWVAKLTSRLRGGKAPLLFDRYIPGEITRRVSTIIGLSVAWNLLGILLLLATEGTRPGVGMQDVVFEQVSAFGTVGLSTGLTPDLGVIGRLWIIVTMFVGRLGPLTLALSMFSRRQTKIHYPEGRIMIG
jgi:trk system potassium uptake protein TrkH